MLEHIIGRRVIQIGDSIAMAIIHGYVGPMKVFAAMKNLESDQRTPILASFLSGGIARLSMPTRGLEPGSYQLVFTAGEEQGVDPIPVTLLDEEQYCAWLTEAAQPAIRYQSYSDLFRVLYELQDAVQERLVPLLGFASLDRIGTSTRKGVFNVQLPYEVTAEQGVTYPVDSVLWVAEFLFDEMIDLSVRIRSTPSFNVIFHSNRVDLIVSLELHSVYPNIADEVMRAARRLRLANITGDILDYHSEVRISDSTVVFFASLGNRAYQHALVLKE